LLGDELISGSHCHRGNKVEMIFMPLVLHFCLPSINCDEKFVQYIVMKLLVR